MKHKERMLIVNKHKPWYKRGLHYSNQSIMLSFGFYFRSFGILLKKNGSSLDFSLDLFFVYFHLCFWDRYWKNFKFNCGIKS